MNAWVYMLECADGSFYVGPARGSLEARIGQHQTGHFPGGYTASRLPVHLVWSQDFQRITDAVAFERQLKGWSRAKKNALIKNDYEEVSRFAKRKTLLKERNSSSFETRPSGAPQDEDVVNARLPHPEEAARVAVSKGEAGKAS